MMKVLINKLKQLSFFSGAIPLIYAFYIHSKSDRQKNNPSLSVSFKLGVASTPYLVSRQLDRANDKM